MAAADGTNQQAVRNRQLSTSGNSLYDLLGLEKTATPEEIKRSYRKKAFQCHPDKNQGNDEAMELFKQINHANSVLTDPTKKKIYDQYGSMGLHLASQLGEERFGTYLLLQKPCAKTCCYLCCYLFLLTGCCCCCCCCRCCCCFRCGKCGPQEDFDDEYPAFDSRDEEEGQAVTNEPTSAANPGATNSTFHDDRDHDIDPKTPIVLGPPPSQTENHGASS